MGASRRSPWVFSGSIINKSASPFRFFSKAEYHQCHHQRHPQNHHHHQDQHHHQHHHQEIRSLLGIFLSDAQVEADIVTVMPQITGDASYSGSDLFSVIVYNNELS